MTTTLPPPPSPRKLAAATLVALGVAAAVLVVAVLPAEYGVDPTGLGRALGFSRLSDAPPPVVDPAPGDAEATLFELRATWRLVEIPLAKRSGSVDEVRSEARVTLPLAVENLTSVTARLAWNDSAAGDTLEASIRGPGGARSQLAQATSAPGAPGNVSVTLNLASAPFPEEGDGALTIPTAPDTRGVGNWTFIVRLYSAGNVSWDLDVTGEAYELALERQEGRFGDRVQLTLAPGRDVEYKFEMQPDATMDYRWNASAPVYFDLHGDHFDDPEDFTSARIATLAADAGTYTAPFHGRHGWYFRNDGAAPVTIELETRGDYRILGVV